MRVEGIDSITNYQLQNTVSSADSNADGGLGLRVDEPVINQESELVVGDDEGLIIPQVNPIEFIVLPIDSLDDTLPPMAELPPLETTLVDGELVHTHIEDDSLLNRISSADSNANGGLGLRVDEPVINQESELVVGDDEGLIIPQVNPIEFIVLPIDSLDDTLPPMVELPPLETTLVDGELVHTPIFPEVGIDNTISVAHG